MGVNKPQGQNWTRFEMNATEIVCGLPDMGENTVFTVAAGVCVTSQMVSSIQQL